MKEKTLNTQSGIIHYYTNEIKVNKKTLIFLPGLSADHRLFDKQIEYFKDKYNVLVWDAPYHAKSYPFKLDFNLFDKAKWLNMIIEKENLKDIIIIGQSMGGYVGQVYSELYKDKLKGFVSIDSAPLNKKYMSKIELYFLKHTKLMYKLIPWNLLLKYGSDGVSETKYGRKLMYDMMMDYDKDRTRYLDLTSYGFKIIAEAIESGLEFKLECPSILICGEKDKAGTTIKYNKKWNKETNIPIKWIKNSGHNSNTDKPEEINEIIHKLVKEIK